MVSQFRISFLTMMDVIIIVLKQGPRYNANVGAAKKFAHAVLIRISEKFYKSIRTNDQLPSYRVTTQSLINQNIS